MRFILAHITKMYRCPCIIKASVLSLILIMSFASFTYSQIVRDDWQYFKQEYGTLSFSYPGNWHLRQKNDSKNSAYNENQAILPYNQSSYKGNRGEAIILINDPMSVMENALSTSATFSMDLFKRFISESFSINATPLTKTYNGITYFEHTQNWNSDQSRILGIKSPAGNMYVVVLSASQIDNYLGDILLRVAMSIRNGEPGTSMSEAAKAAKGWYTALNQGNYNLMQQYTCNSANQINGLISIFGQAMGLNNTMDIVANMAKGYDFSKLKFYEIAGNNQVAAVRVCGFILTPQGQKVTFFDYTHSNIFAVKFEKGAWRLCQSL